MSGALRRHVLSKQGLLILLPSLVMTAIFVYAVVGTSFFFSLTNWRTLALDLSLREPLWQTYADMLSMPAFRRTCATRLCSHCSSSAFPLAWE